MRHRISMGGGGLVLALIGGAPALAATFGEGALEVGSEGWYGPQWERNAETGALLSSVEITPRPGGADYWIQVTIEGVGVEYGWSMGPYTDEAVPFSVAIDLPPQANGLGLVQVFVLMTATHPETGDNMAHERTPPAFVTKAGVDGETWYDEAAAAAAVVRRLPIPLSEGEVVDGLVGLEVSQ